MAPVVQQLATQEQIESVVCVTAQHRQMLDQVLEIFNIRPDFDLNVMKSNQSLSALTGHLITGVTEVIEKCRPDYVLVHGDTTSSMASSLAAFYAKVPVGHVEAGLRTGNLQAPWPEEMNRRVNGLLANLHFAPTEGAKENLLKEGVLDSSILVTGNTVIDALLEVSQKIQSSPQLNQQLTSQFSSIDFNKPLILVTGHRRENFGQGFLEICEALKAIATSENVEIVYPVHLNPNVQKPVKQILGDVSGVHLISPLPYLPFVYLMMKSHLIITDSGGVQEEAPSLGKPVLVMREVTERPEAVAAGTVKLVGANVDAIVSATRNLLNDREEYLKMSMAHNPYGDGRASQRIVERLLL